MPWTNAVDRPQFPAFLSATQETVVAGLVEKPERQIRHAGEQQPFALDLLTQSPHLALQRLEKKVSHGVQAGASVRMVPWVRRNAR